MAFYDGFDVGFERNDSPKSFWPEWTELLPSKMRRFCIDLVCGMGGNS